MAETGEGSPPSPPKRAPLPQWWWNMTIPQRRLVAVGVLLVIILAPILAVSALGGGGDGDGEPDPEEFVAELPPAQLQRWLALAQCESRSEWSINTGNGFYGGLQFELDSWEAVGGTGLPSDASEDEQIMRAQFLFEIQGWDAWPQCSAQLGFT